MSSLKIRHCIQFLFKLPAREVLPATNLQGFVAHQHFFSFQMLIYLSMRGKLLKHNNLWYLLSMYISIRALSWWYSYNDSSYQKHAVLQENPWPRKPKHVALWANIHSHKIRERPTQLALEFLDSSIVETIVSLALVIEDSFRSERLESGAIQMGPDWEFCKDVLVWEIWLSIDPVALKWVEHACKPSDSTFGEINEETPKGRIRETENALVLEARLSPRPNRWDRIDWLMEPNPLKLEAGFGTFRLDITRDVLDLVWISRTCSQKEND